jgi:hypothetical protein
MRWRSRPVDAELSEMPDVEVPVHAPRAAPAVAALAVAAALVGGLLLGVLLVAFASTLSAALLF